MSLGLFNKFILRKQDEELINAIGLFADHERKRDQAVKEGEVYDEFCIETLKELKYELQGYLLAAYQILLFKYTREESSVFGFVNEDTNPFDVRIIFGQVDAKTTLKTLYENHKELMKDKLFNTMYLIGYNKGEQKIDTDFIFRINKQENRIKIHLSYNVNLYKEPTMKAFVKHFVHIVKQLMNNNEVMVKDIEIISEEEKQNILQAFNEKEGGFPNKPSHRVFEDIVIGNQHKVALIDQEREMTYEELNQRANQLAHKLIELGVHQEEIVGIMMDRSLEMIIAMLGILKAGGAYLPIDSEYPEERKIFMISDSKVNILLIREGIVTPSEYKGNIVCVDSKQPLEEDYPNIEKNIDPDNLCYVIYTSGSTGNPKGVMVEHKGVVRLVINTNYIQFQEDDRILQASSPVFDAATFEIWGSLLNGLGLCIVSKEATLSAKGLKEAIERNKITILWLTSALFNQITDQDASVYAPLRYLLVGGDIVSVKYMNRVKKMHPHIITINGYGPTENTTFSTCHIIDEFYEKNIPIGKPISHSTAYVVDEGNNLQPIGVPGEICFGGSGVARGYLNREDLTREKFVKSPFNSEDTVYYSGDLGRWLCDGTIEFLGRIDSQVKIRGYRIEIGEVEACLLQNKDIKEAVVLVKQGSDNEKLLYAYLTSDRELTVSELREYLLGKLPAYMVPSHYIQVENMPLNTSGKVDKRALLKLQGKMKTGAEYVEPRTEEEKKLAEIWQEVLEVYPIGIGDKFFDLGGDSLSAARICVMAHDANIELEVSDILSKRTIENILTVGNGENEELDQFTLVQNRYYLKDYGNLSNIQGEEAITHYNKERHYTKNELKVVAQNEITTYLHRSLPLCVLLAYENYKPWYYCNYIQVFSYEDENGFVELNYLDTRDSYSEILDVICLGYHLLDKENNIVEFVKNKINLGYYIIINLDEYELSNKKDYLKNHFVHPSLIYGYDDDTSTVKAIGFNKERLFIEIEFSYEELKGSYDSSKEYFVDYAPWCAWSAIQLIKPKVNAPLFPFSISKFMRDLKEYIYSIEDTYRLYNFEYPREKIKYGLDVYDVLGNKLNEMLNGKFSIDYRALHLLSEHKKCLYDKITYIIEKYRINGDITVHTESLMQLVKTFNDIRLKYLAEAFSNFDINCLTNTQIQMINEVTKEIKNLKEKEFDVLEKIYKSLELYLNSN